VLSEESLILAKVLFRFRSLHLSLFQLVVIELSDCLLKSLFFDGVGPSMLLENTAWDKDVVVEFKVARKVIILGEQEPIEVIFVLLSRAPVSRDLRSQVKVHDRSLWCSRRHSRESTVWMPAPNWVISADVDCLVNAAGNARLLHLRLQLASLDLHTVRDHASAGCLQRISNHGFSMFI